MPQPKPFQNAAIAAACASFQSTSSSKRFLVADEVGLGKTVVAQQVIQRLASADRDSPLIVYYITNGQRLAHQNRDRLVDFLSEDDQKKALSKADRLNLIPLYDVPETPAVLYALTPGTSFPGGTTRLHAGRKEERAFLTALLGRTYPHLVRKLPENAMRRNVTSDWKGLVRYYRGPVAALPRRFIRAFRAALITEFGVPIKLRLPAVCDEETPGRFVGRLRKVLAHTVLIDRPPDLVILDEFQRYRDMLAKENRDDPLVRALFEPSTGRRPALLMLSATPYKLFATRLEENRGTEANHEFFDLMEFLGGARGAELKRSAEDAFAKFGAALLSIAENHNDRDETARLIAEASVIRDKIQDMLAPYLSRMERAPTTDDSARTHELDTVLEPADVRAFRHLVSSFQPEHAWFALPFWLSVPLPAQTLGLRYMAWRDADMRRDAALIKLTEDARNHYRLPQKWPSLKLRALESVTSAEALSLPWVPPSIPWWPLRGTWTEIAHDPKLLLFSRFKSTPQSIAALTSLRVEAVYLSRQSYDRAWKGRRLQAGPSRLPTIALFHPSPFLISETDPLPTRASNSASVRERVRTQLNDALKRLQVEVKRSPGKQCARRKPLWTLLAALDRKAGFAALTKAAWKNAAAEDSVLDLMEEWHAPDKIDWISRREFDDLVTAAIGSPGIIVGRALRRHFSDALSPKNYADVVRVAWLGLRPYLDNPVFWARLPKGKPVRVLRRACQDGNLEAVLDEHFWMRRQSLPTRERGLAADLLEALSVTTGAFSLHSVNKERLPRIRVRCHVAVPFGSSDEKDRRTGKAVKEQPPRSDELRNAFNSPFWPHVLATTSVGQEGLDFHTWCSRVVHWDLCPSPIELEQREGRIQRFGGLAIRRHLRELGDGALAESATADKHRSLWSAVETLANEKYRDPSGLSPWWVLKGAAVSRYVFNLKQSRDVEKFKLLREQRLIYRLALGQPNQEDLVEFLAKGGPALTEALRPLALDFSAISRELPTTRD
jgi:Type III restriction enzyme, res subunit